MTGAAKAIGHVNAEDTRLQFQSMTRFWAPPAALCALLCTGCPGNKDTAVIALLRQVSDTGVLTLSGTIVPDAPVLVTLVRVGERQQILYWDEIEAPNHGINIQSKPHHLAFKKTWHAIGQTLTDNIPGESSPFSVRFMPPSSWYVKEPIQSERDVRDLTVTRSWAAPAANMSVSRSPRSQSCAQPE